jgi:hypothetical protein
VPVISRVYALILRLQRDRAADTAWLARSYYEFLREHEYKNIPRRIMIEEFIDDGSTGAIPGCGMLTSPLQHSRRLGYGGEGFEPRSMDERLGQLWV